MMSDKIFQNFAEYSNAKDNNYIVGVVNFVTERNIGRFENFFHFKNGKCICTEKPAKNARNKLNEFQHSMLDNVGIGDTLVSVNGKHIDKNSIEAFKRLVTSIFPTKDRTHVEVCFKRAKLY